MTTSLRRLRLRLILAGLLLFAVCSAPTLSSRRAADVSRKIDANSAMLADLSSLLAEITTAQTWHREYLFAGDLHYRAEYQKHAVNVSQTMHQITALTLQSPELSSGVDELSATVDAELNAMQSAALLVGKSTADLPTGISRPGSLEPVRILVRRMQEDQQGLLTEAIRTRESLALLTLTASLIGGLLAFTILALSGQHALWHLRARMSAEKAARGAEQRFDAFMRYMPLPVFIKDADGRMVFVNAALEQTWQITLADWKGKDDFALWPRDVADELRKADLQVLSGEAAARVLERVPLPSGDKREFISVKFPFRLPDEELYLGGVAIDVTDTRAETERLQASEQFNHSILQSSGDCITVLQLDGEIISMNEPGRQLLQIPEFQSAIGKPFLSFWSGEGSVAAEAALTAAHRGETTQFEAFCPTYRGESRWWSVVVSPMEDAKGDVMRLLSRKP